MEGNRIPKSVLYMNLGTTRLRGRPRNRWQDEVREDGQIVGGEGWQEKVHNREEWKKLLRTAKNRHILHMPMEWMDEQGHNLQLHNIMAVPVLSYVCENLTMKKKHERQQGESFEMSCGIFFVWSQNKWRNYKIIKHIQFKVHYCGLHLQVDTVFINNEWQTNALPS